MLATEVDTDEDNFKSSDCLTCAEPELREDLWTEECLIDELFLLLAATKKIVKQNDKFITVYKYYTQARQLMEWIRIANPTPEFIVNISDLTPRIISELKALDDPRYVLKSAVGRIFENIDPRRYHLSIARKLKVRLSK
jgi:hypothetical protein